MYRTPAAAWFIVGNFFVSLQFHSCQVSYSWQKTDECSLEMLHKEEILRLRSNCRQI